MARMKGADLITEYLIDSGIPFVFGICGHGNVGILDTLYEARDRIKLVSPRHEQVAGSHGRRLLPRAARSCRNTDIVRARFVQYRDAARGCDFGFIGIAGDHGQCADVAVQPEPVPGNKQALSGRLPKHHPSRRETQLSAHARGYVAAGAAAGDLRRCSRAGRGR